MRLLVIVSWLGHISEKALERADKLSRIFRKQRRYDEKDTDVLRFRRIIHPAPGARFIPLAKAG